MHDARLERRIQAFSSLNDVVKGAQYFHWPVGLDIPLEVLSIDMMQNNEVNPAIVAIVYQARHMGIIQSLQDISFSFEPFE